MLKKDARNLYREKRKLLTPAQMEKGDDLILIHFQQLRMPFLQHCMSYFPLEHQKEVDPSGITRYLSFRFPAIQIAYPRTNAETFGMDALVTDEHTVMTANSYGIPEPLSGKIIPPQEMDLVLIPLMAFDETGHRVGYGKGYYDRYLSLCEEDCIRVGLSYFEPVERLDDSGAHDVQLHFCITPRQVYAF